MPRPTRLLFLLVLLPFFCLSSEARADNVIITSGSYKLAGFTSGFYLANKGQGFAAYGYTEGGAIQGPDSLPGGRLYPSDTVRPGDTVTANFLQGLYSIHGGQATSATINGATYSPVFYAHGPGNEFNFAGGSITLPPVNSPPPPSPNNVASFKVAFTFSGKLTGYPCDNNFSSCENNPLFPTQNLSGQGTATLKFYIVRNGSDYFYEFAGVAYDFLNSSDLSTLSAGSGAQKFAFTISEHGNIRHLESPATFTHLSTREGYVLCSAGSTPAFNDGEVESGWGGHVISRPGGANTLPLTITRTTLDGRFELKQLFEWDSNQREINITMTLKNLSGGAVAGVKLSRYFDGDIDRDQNDDRYASISDSVWGWDDGSGPNHHGLMLTALSTSFQHALAVERFSAWAATGAGAQTARTCTPASIATPTAPGDYVGRLTYNLGTIPAGASKTMKVQYKRL